MSNRRIRKLYYSIREVSQITALKPYVLRFWETEFEELRPKKNRAGNRTYRLEDIKLVFLIKKLLYEEKYTIEGARQRLKKMQLRGQQMDLSFDRLRHEDALSEIKNGLHAILDILNESDHTPPSRPATRAGRRQPRTVKARNAVTSDGREGSEKDKTGGSGIPTS